MDNQSTSMRKEMDETMAGLTEKLGQLEHQVSATVNTVSDSVNTVRNNLDLKLHVRRRPWTVLAGATAVGFLSGYRSNSRRNGHARENGSNAGNTAPPLTVAAEHQYSGTNGDSKGSNTAPLASSPAPSWLANLGDKFQPEIAELKGIVIGTLIGIAREIITKQVEAPIGRSIRDDHNSSVKTSIHSVAPPSDDVDE